MNLWICFDRSQGFYVALRLVASAQSGQEVSLSSLNLNAPPPKFVSTSSSSTAPRPYVARCGNHSQFSAALRPYVTWRGNHSSSSTVLTVTFTKCFYPKRLASIHTRIQTPTMASTAESRRQPSNLPVTSQPTLPPELSRPHVRWCGNNTLLFHSSEVLCTLVRITQSTLTVS